MTDLDGLIAWHRKCASEWLEAFNSDGPPIPPDAKENVRKGFFEAYENHEATADLLEQLRVTA